ncbi:hypothetical protein [Xanthobacter autotrophicus]|uniref:hypothetical protein n=1 Tax=Xanthobacter autotrophicus TaxID=280 RepID=UPI00372C7937
MALPVPQLRQKLALLRRLPHSFGWDGLASAIGKSRKTMQEWVRGTATRAPDQIAEDSLPAFLALLARYRPDLDEKARARLFLGPLLDFETALLGASTHFIEILNRDAVRQGVRLILADEASGLIERDEPVPDDRPRLRFRQRFRLEYPPRPGCPHAVALQQIGRIWGASMPFRTANALLVPSVKRTGEPAYMFERTHPGHHRFYLVQAGEAFAPEVREYLRTAAPLDGRFFQALATLYEDLGPDRRACHVIDIEIEPA